VELAEIDARLQEADGNCDAIAYRRDTQFGNSSHDTSSIRPRAVRLSVRTKQSSSPDPIHAQPKQLM